MKMRPSRTEDNYRAVLREVSAYFENELEAGTHDGQRLDLPLIEAYEAKHYPVAIPEQKFVESGANNDSFSRF